MATFTENGWPAGWTPSAGEKGNLSGTPSGLLRMDNLTLDELGVLRAAKGIHQESLGYAGGTGAFSNNILSLFSANYNLDNGATTNLLKARYVYYAGSGAGNGHLARNYGGATNSLTNYDLSISTTGTNSFAAFLPALGHIFIALGTTVYKDRGDVQSAVGLPAPSNPTIVANNAPVLRLDNPDGSGFYTNWSSIDTSGAFDNTGADVYSFSDPTTNTFAITTVFASTFDATNMAGAGTGTDGDAFLMNILTGAQESIASVQVSFLCEALTGSTVTIDAADYFTLSIPIGDFALQGNSLWTSLGGTGLTRGSFTRVGVNTAKGWNTIKQVLVIVNYTSGVAEGTAIQNIEFRGGDTGTLTGAYNYIVQQANNTGQYIEYGMISAQFPAFFDSNGNTTITPGGAVAAKANMYLIYRQDPGDGIFLLLQTQTGANGFTPAPFTDSVDLTTLQTNAIVNPLVNVLNLYSQPIPANVIGMIYFAARIVYLTPTAFIPSQQLNPGLTDARFVYELTGTDTETCLFIAKLDVQDFIVATTKDFYRVTGDFSTISDGTTDTLNISISSLGVSDPAISHVWVEYEGSIMYLSATGIRTLQNASSTLINDSLDLLFRGEARYSIPAFALLPSDQSIVGAATSGNRVYWSLPHTDGVNRIYVVTLGEIQYSTQTIPRTWRMWTLAAPAANPTTLFREEDGTIICGSVSNGTTNFIYSLENTAATTALPIHFRNMYNYATMPNNRKDPLEFVALINTGGQTLTLNFYGLQVDGTVLTYTTTASSATDTIIRLDLKTTLGPCIAFELEATCTTTTFYLDWFMLEYSARPDMVLRHIIYGTNFDYPGRKRIGDWPLIFDSLGNNVSAVVTIDGAAQAGQTLATTGPRTVYWRSTPNTNDIGIDWQLELTSTTFFEFYKALNPVVLEQFPDRTFEAIQDTSNLGTAARKQIAKWPFTVNPNGGTITITVIVDGTTLATSTVTGSIIQTFGWTPATGADTGFDWSIQLTSTTLFEFYKFLDPVMVQTFPVPVNTAFMPSTNFGSPGLKRISRLPFTINPLGGTVTLTVVVDGSTLATQSITGTGIDTYSFLTVPTLDTGIDWSLKLTSTTPFEFYKFLDPVITEKFPVTGEHMVLEPTNYEYAGRKRIGSIPFTLNPNGQTITAKPIIDGNVQPTFTVTGSIVETFFYQPAGLIGVDWGLDLSAAAPFSFYSWGSPDVTEKFPMQVSYMRQTPTNFGTIARKRIGQWPFRINTLSNTVVATVIMDGVAQTPFNCVSSTPTVFDWIPPNGADIGTDFELDLTSTGLFEFYGFQEPTILEKFPEPAERAIQHYTNFGTVARKRVGSWPFNLNPLGNLTTATLYLDGNIVATLTTSANRIITLTVNPVPGADVGIDWQLDITSVGLIEFYSFLEPDITQKFPVPVLSMRIPANNFGVAARKRLGVWPFRANSLNTPISAEVIVDGVAQPPQVFNNAADEPTTFSWIQTNALGKDWELQLSSASPFEFYEVMEPTIVEKFPVPVLATRVPANNFGIAARKMLGTWPFRANSLGNNITCTVLVDGVPTAAQIFTNPVDEPTTFPWRVPSTTGVDWEMQLVSTVPFEYYEAMSPSITQSFPVPTLEVIQPATNYGKASLKKISTLPFMVDPRGSTLTISVVVDGATQAAQTLAGTGIQTGFWNNNLDFAGIDWAITITGAAPFEFYKFYPPEVLQVFPMAKLIDQVGPLDLGYQGMIHGFRLRVLPSTPAIHYIVYDGDAAIYSNDLAVVQGIDQAYIEVFPKGIDPAVCRLVLSASNLFHRYSLEFKVRLTGKETEDKFIKLKDSNAGN